VKKRKPVKMFLTEKTGKEYDVKKNSYMPNLHLRIEKRRNLKVGKIRKIRNRLGRIEKAKRKMKFFCLTLNDLVFQSEDLINVVSECSKNHLTINILKDINFKLSSLVGKSNCVSTNLSWDYKRDTEKIKSQKEEIEKIKQEYCSKATILPECGICRTELVFNSDFVERRCNCNLVRECNGMSKYICWMCIFRTIKAEEEKYKRKFNLQDVSCPLCKGKMFDMSGLDRTLLREREKRLEDAERRRRVDIENEENWNLLTRDYNPLEMLRHHLEEGVHESRINENDNIPFLQSSDFDFT